MREGCPLSPLLFNIVLEFLGSTIRQEKEIQRIQIGKEETKLSQFVDDMILYLKDPKKATRSHRDIQQSSRIQNQYTKLSRISIHNEQSEKEIRKIIPFTIAPKN
jgi:hypothetical protein